MDFLAQCSTINVLHRDEMHALSYGRATARLTNFINVSDVRMVQRRRSFRLAHEALHPISIRSNLSGQNLQSNLAIKLCILRQIHFAHPAHAELRDDFVVRNGLVDESHFFKS